MIRWTQDQVAQLRRLVEAGLSSTAIAEEMGMTPESVRSKMRQIGLRSRWAGNCGDWDADRIEMLRRLWADGHSARQIAETLGGITRCAVIGKVHRLGLSGRAKIAAPAKPKKPRAARCANLKRWKPVIVENRDAAAIEHVAETAAELPETAFSGPAGAVDAVQSLKRGECKWPMGDPSEPDFRFCRTRQKPGSSYCEFHAAKAKGHGTPSERRAHVDAEHAAKRGRA